MILECLDQRELLIHADRMTGAAVAGFVTDEFPFPFATVIASASSLSLSPMLMRPCKAALA